MLLFISFCWHSRDDSLSWHSVVLLSGPTVMVCIFSVARNLVISVSVSKLKLPFSRLTFRIRLVPRGCQVEGGGEGRRGRERGGIATHAHVEEICT